jgi:hypothetical protein
LNAKPELQWHILNENALKISAFKGKIEILERLKNDKNMT